jgi:hypothetical protein
MMMAVTALFDVVRRAVLVLGFCQSKNKLTVRDVQLNSKMERNVISVL